MAIFLNNNFFEIISQHSGENKNQLHAEIRINKDHPVFSGHFPEQPVVPGVFMIQMIIEILSDYLQEEVILKELRNVKFLSFIDPGINQILEVKLEITEEYQHSCHVTAVIAAGAQVFLKSKGLYQKISEN
jgi:3-hydroxyacyl-[acyl-carrier-protein] dehydratase